MDNVELLMSFGLTRQEARVYVLLLGEGALSGYEAAKRLGISRSNAYAALAGLVEIRERPIWQKSRQYSIMQFR